MELEEHLGADGRLGPVLVLVAAAGAVREVAPGGLGLEGLDDVRVGDGLAEVVAAAAGDRREERREQIVPVEDRVGEVRVRRRHATPGAGHGHEHSIAVLRGRRDRRPRRRGLHGQRRVDERVADLVVGPRAVRRPAVDDRAEDGRGVLGRRRQRHEAGVEGEERARAPERRRQRVRREERAGRGDVDASEARGRERHARVPDGHGPLARPEEAAAHAEREVGAVPRAAADGGVGRPERLAAVADGEGHGDVGQRRVHAEAVLAVGAVDGVGPRPHARAAAADAVGHGDVDARARREAAERRRQRDARGQLRHREHVAVQHMTPAPARAPLRFVAEPLAARERRVERRGRDRRQGGAALPPEDARGRVGAVEVRAERHARVSAHGQRVVARARREIVGAGLADEVPVHPHESERRALEGAGEVPGARREREHAARDARERIRVERDARRVRKHHFVRRAFEAGILVAPQREARRRRRGQHDCAPPPAESQHA